MRHSRREDEDSVNALSRFCWKNREWFSQQKSTRLSLKSRVGAEVFGFRFHVAAHKKDAFTDQYAGSLRKPTFSTESTQSGRS